VEQLGLARIGAEQLETVVASELEAAGVSELRPRRRKGPMRPGAARVLGRRDLGAEQVVPEHVGGGAGRDRRGLRAE
jgi:hypothetical protein